MMLYLYPQFTIGCIGDPVAKTGFYANDQYKRTQQWNPCPPDLIFNVEVIWADYITQTLAEIQLKATN